VCVLASRCRRHAWRRCAPVGPRTCALRTPRGFALRGSVLPCLPHAWAVAQRRRCRGTHLPSLFPIFSPYSPTMHAPRPPIFLASCRTARKQQSPRPRQLPPPHHRARSMAASTSSHGRATLAPARPASPSGDAWQRGALAGRPTNDLARAPAPRSGGIGKLALAVASSPLCVRSTSAW
jgi:hypothetical protein